ncbi:DivIVA domain-containing protein [Agromyces sp. CF514]|uniref:DivIVA domain-containing protein n=1 Tax=Agromyces sp. CF514 TaxID=1881031 RepID=UPI0008F275E5|nr:DivIVA domain-containing protein [Agromyces sp. CF514]SFR69303.1 DivIVA domain-containing protein [Agromyces sp. CF514]
MTMWEDEEEDLQIPRPPAPEGGLVAAVSRLPERGDVTFATRPIGGYDRAEVDAFVADLAQTIAEVHAALDEDRRALAELRAENTRLRSTDTADLENEVALGAVGLLSQAQMIADKAVADAEAYARDLVLTARTQYRETQERNANAAAAASAASAASAAAEPTTATGSIALPSMPEIEFVRTYAQVAQIQLRSVLDALTEQVDRLGTLPHPEVADASAPGAAASEDSAFPPSQDLPDDEFPDEEPNWLPAVPPQPTIQRQTYVSP